MSFEATKAALEAFEASLDGIGGCSDSSCLVKKRVGMCTNGGCRCFSYEPFKATQLAMATRRFHNAVKAAISTPTDWPAT